MNLETNTDHSCIPSQRKDEMHIFYNENQSIENLTKSSTETDDTKELQIHYVLDNLNIMNRPVNESMCKTLKRFQASLQKKIDKSLSSQKKSEKNSEKKSSKKKKSIGMIEEEEERKEKKTNDMLSKDMSIIVYYNNQEQNITELTNRDWRNDMIIFCPSFDLSFKVVMNPPYITSIYTFPKKVILSNSPIVATVRCQYADIHRTTYEWYRKSNSSIGDSINDSILVSTNRIYYTTEEDIGCSLKLYCTPHRVEISSVKDGIETFSLLSGRVIQASFQGDVIQGPTEIGTHQARKTFNNIPRYQNNSFKSSCSSSLSFSSPTDVRGVNDLRVVTYNILADPYATSDFAQNYIYSYVRDPIVLDAEYRCQLVIRELLSYDADVIALQECDEKSFDLYFYPILTSVGYSGHYAGKDNEAREGCALFIKDTMLFTEKFVSIPIRNYLQSVPELQELYQSRPDISEILNIKLGTIIQIGICQWKDTSCVLLIANTHLFYHPSAEYVRLLQTYSILQILNNIKTFILSNGIQSKLEFIEHLGGSIVSTSKSFDLSSTTLPSTTSLDVVVFVMGDLNSTLKNSAIELLERGRIDSDHNVWRTVNDFTWNQQMKSHPNNTLDHQETVVDQNYDDIRTLIPNLTHPFQLYSVAGYPKYTNYTVAFKNILDYIYTESSRFEMVRVAPFPSEEELSYENALPSTVFPSDHLSIAVDIRWKT